MAIKVKSQKGAGYTFDQSDVMGGQMAVKGYSECDTPAYFNRHQIYDVKVGGAKKSKSKSKKSKSKKTKKTTKKTMKKTMKMKKGKSMKSKK
jgi:hypothetical protein